MKYIKISFRGKNQKDIHLSLEKWAQIINNPSSQIVAYTLDHEKEWAGRTFNLADVVYSEPDGEYRPKQKEPIIEIRGNKAVITGYLE